MLSKKAAAKATAKKKPEAKKPKPHPLAGVTRDQYLGMLADQMVAELRAVAKMTAFTNNPELLGGYAEAAVRRLVRRYVHPLRVSEGAVVDFPPPPDEKTKQLDTIIWSPYPAPAVFEVDNFGLIPKSSACGALEIKRSNYPDTDVEIENFVKLVRTGAIVWMPEEHPPKKVPGMGVICLIKYEPSKRLNTLVENEEAVAIFDVRNGLVDVRNKDVLVLINFLQSVVHRQRLLANRDDWPALPLPTAT